MNTLSIQRRERQGKSGFSAVYGRSVPLVYYPGTFDIIAQLIQILTTNGIRLARRDSNRRKQNK